MHNVMQLCGQVERRSWVDTDFGHKEGVVTMLMCNHHERGHGYFPRWYGMSKYEDNNY